MSPTSASQRTASSCAFLKRPLRRLEKVTCLEVTFSIFLILIFSLVIPDSLPATQRLWIRRENDCPKNLTGRIRKGANEKKEQEEKIKLGIHAHAPTADRRHPAGVPRRITPLPIPNPREFQRRKPVGQEKEKAYSCVWQWSSS